MAYDSKCYDLAEQFLEDIKDPTIYEKAELAQIIQDAIDEWFMENIIPGRRVI